MITSPCCPFYKPFISVIFRTNYFITFPDVKDFGHSMFSVLVSRYFRQIFYQSKHFGILITLSKAISYITVRPIQIGVLLVSPCLDG